MTILKLHLIEWSGVKQINECFLSLYFSTIKMQKRYRTLMLIRETRLDMLEKRWNFEYSTLMKYCMKHKAKNKKARSLVKKMNSLTNDMRDTILRAFMVYMNQ